MGRTNNLPFDPANGIFTPATAARLLGLRPTEEETARLEYLAALANQGQLTAEEREEYGTRIRLGKFLSMMQLKAKLLTITGLACCSGNARRHGVPGRGR